MITVAPSACAALAKLLEDGDVQRQFVVRVIMDAQQNLQLSLEAPRIEDAVFSYRGRNVLAVEPSAAVVLSGTSLEL